MPNPKKIKSSDKRTVAIEKANEAGLKGEERDNYIKAMSPAQFNAGLKKASADGKLDNNPKFKAAVDSSPAKAKGSPYMLYGKEASPATMMGESPLAKYGCSKKMKKSK